MEHVPLMSLPMVFSTDQHTIPASVPYLKAFESRPERLKVVQPAGGLSIGLVWASNPDNKAMYRNKSVPLDLLMPCLLPPLRLSLS